MWSIAKIEYYLALQGKDILTHAAVCVNLDNVIRSEVSRSHQDKHCLIPSCQTHRKGGRMELARAWGEGGWVLRFISVWVDEMFWKWIAMTVVQQRACI